MPTNPQSPSTHIHTHPHTSTHYPSTKASTYFCLPNLPPPPKENPTTINNKHQIHSLHHVIPTCTKSLDNLFGFFHLRNVNGCVLVMKVQLATQCALFVVGPSRLRELGVWVTTVAPGSILMWRTYNRNSILVCSPEDNWHCKFSDNHAYDSWATLQCFFYKNQQRVGVKKKLYRHHKYKKRHISRELYHLRITKVKIHLFHQP